MDEKKKNLNKSDIFSSSNSIIKKPVGCQRVFSYTGLNFIKNLGRLGGGFYIEEDKTICVVFFKNYFKRNVAQEFGGAVCLQPLRYPLFFYNFFEENEALNGGSIYSYL